MSDRSTPSRWFSERPGLSLLTILSTALAVLIILPYLQYVLLAIVLAYVLMPAQRRLEQYVRSMTAALVLVAVAILVILLPVMYVLAIALREALQLLTAIQEGTLGMADIEQRLEATGYVIDLSDLYETYQEPIGTAAQGLATSGIELVSGLPGLLIGLTVTLFVLFALLRDGDRLVVWIQQVLPIEAEIQEELLTELDRLMWASVVGNVLVAAIQALALGIGLAVLGLPAVVFLTVATFVLALLPLVGAFGVWVPVALYLLVVGDFVGAGALVIYGSIVSASDTYLRPALIGRTSAFNSAIIVVGIFGGIIIFGAVGLFVGPVILGGAKVTLDVFAREQTAELKPPIGPGSDRPAADPAVDTSAQTGVRAVIEDATPADADTRVESAGSQAPSERQPDDGDGDEGDDASESDDENDDDGDSDDESDAIDLAEDEPRDGNDR
ncbi:AI-2E family transporter [Natronorubrum daqingense]|uniref:AI-2E family transporter n=1 Tax=Natronorubrum daqingense TaxID=588898 RepID=A0A1N7E632_9EURY|nr:AI-2E family transporter [Natronorubrum daqingense]APX96379.1 AI-2E family transporter [Natronorubrum daqingense]SIR83455.1 Predicted PurR-regulated permease PerM [Natronorubrum daqingense]